MSEIKASVADFHETFGSDTCLLDGSAERHRSVKPKISTGVRLIGKMNGLGFRDSQWLIDCSGRFIQVSELLFRVAEQADGTHSLEDIAELVSSRTEWSLDPADVEQLMEAKLVPLGIIGGEHANEARTSPLTLNLKCRTISPRYINPFTSILHLLCNSFIVCLVIMSAATTHWWLYRLHGVQRGFEEAIYTPGGVLLAMGMVLLAAVFHEFGHASALRHHGGRVGNMGVGLYLIYPALYTDVSDNYRLSRWARVSTDLGGIYFHLIFTLGLFVSYFVTHRELYLFCVLLIDLAILEQFIPLIRLDGYWLLCDITGIPDFFSCMAPFVSRSLSSQAGRILEDVTGTSAKGATLPDLKPWAKAIFITYTFLTVPLLGYVFIQMILSFPEFVTTAWSGLQAQVAILKAINIQKDFGTALLVLLQIFFLTLPLPATVYLLWVTLKPSLRRFVDWTTRSRRNTFAGVTAIVACCGITAAFVSAPSTRQFHHASDPGQKAIRLIHEAQKMNSELNSIVAEVDGVIGDDSFTGRIILQKPNLARVEINGSKGLGKIFLVSDGRTATTYFPETKQFVQVAPGAKGEFIQSTLVQQVEEFFHPESLANAKEFNYLGHRSTDAMEYDVVAPKTATPDEEQVSYFISRSDKLVYRIFVSTNTSMAANTWVILKNVQKNVNINKNLFTLMLPQGSRQVQIPGGLQLPVNP